MGTPSLWRARGVWAESPQRGAGAEPLVRGSVVEIPEAERLLAFEYPMESANLTYHVLCMRQTQ